MGYVWVTHKLLPQGTSIIVLPVLYLKLHFFGVENAFNKKTRSIMGVEHIEACEESKEQRKDTVTARSTDQNPDCSSSSTLLIQKL